MIRRLLVVLVSLLLYFLFPRGVYAVPEGVKTGHSFSLRPSSEIFPFIFSIKIDEKTIKAGAVPKIELKFQNVSKKKENVDFSRVVVFLSSQNREIGKFTFPKDISDWKVSIIPQGFIGLNVSLLDLTGSLPAGDYTVRAYYQMSEDEGINSIGEVIFTVVE